MNIRRVGSFQPPDLESSRSREAAAAKAIPRPSTSSDETPAEEEAKASTGGKASTRTWEAALQGQLMRQQLETRFQAEEVGAQDKPSSKSGSTDGAIPIDQDSISPPRQDGAGASDIGPLRTTQSAEPMFYSLDSGDYPYATDFEQHESELLDDVLGNGSGEDPRRSASNSFSVALRPSTDTEKK
ncbi:MAG: hypothetical protein AB1714_03330 [Acidobacteriota bacterium]